MKVNVGEFTGVLVSVLVGSVILGAMISIFGTISVPDSFANSAAIKSLLDLVPLLAAVGLLLMSIFYFVSRK